MAFDRRSFFGLAGATTLGAALGVPATLAATGQFKEFTGGSSVPFYGLHQAGIATPMQDRLYVAALNIDNISREQLKAVLKELTAAAERMSRGLGAGPIGAVNGQLESPQRSALGLQFSMVALVSRPESRLTLMNFQSLRPTRFLPTVSEAIL